MQEKTIRLLSFELLTCEFRIEDGLERSEIVDPQHAYEGQLPHVEEGVEEPVAEVDANATPEEDPDDPTASGLIELEGASVRYWATLGADEYVLVLQTWITDPAAPYRLELVTGSKFDTADPPAPIEKAAQTLVFISYPYVREAVANVTMRSPYLGFEMPPLTRLPHPNVSGEDASATPLVNE